MGELEDETFCVDRRHIIIVPPRVSAIARERNVSEGVEETELDKLIIQKERERERMREEKGKKLVRNKRGIALSCSSVVYLYGYYYSFRHMFLTFAFCITDTLLPLSTHISVLSSFGISLYIPRTRTMISI